METINFNESVQADECLERAKAFGAVLLKGYVDQKTSESIIEETDIQNMRVVEERDKKVRQQFQTINYRYPGETTPHIARLGSTLEEFLRDELPQWRPNDVAMQRYLPEQTVGIDPHRDYARDKLLVAVTTLAGEADFHIELDDEAGGKSWSKRRLQPGDLVLMRAPGLTEADDDRPYHQIDPPRSEERTSLAFRHNVRLENKNMEDPNGNS